ncbi:MAG: hypothetical protein GXY83_09915, partial [Rhodopirellula sp.]|nr:hypothetical protein [Rhodopirellula sp.]
MIPVVYYGKQIDSSCTGERLVTVVCGKCGCEYYYQLTRIGQGSGTAPYWIGMARAARLARERSEKDLGQRLEHEAELVPCPKCHWINEDMVRGYRRSQYPRMGALAAAVALIGIAGCLIAAWFVSLGPAADRGLLPYLLFAGPIMFLTLAVATILLRNWMRGRIDPNANYPAPPRLPPGSPPPLVIDEDSGVLRPPMRDLTSLRAVPEWLDMQIGRHEIPLVCCDCLGVGALEHAHTTPVTRAFAVTIPRCEACRRSSRRKSRRIWAMTMILGLPVGYAFAALLPLQAAELWILIGGAALALMALASHAACIATLPVTVANGDSSRGVVRLRFRNLAYHSLVAQSFEA